MRGSASGEDRTRDLRMPCRRRGHEARFLPGAEPLRRRTRGGARTHDHKIKSLALCRLSYPGGWLCCCVWCVAATRRAPTVGMRLIHWATKTSGAGDRWGARAAKELPARPATAAQPAGGEARAWRAAGALCQSSPGLEPGISCSHRRATSHHSLRQQVSILRPLGYGPSTLPLRHVARCSLSMLGSNQRPTD